MYGMHGIYLLTFARSTVPDSNTVFYTNTVRQTTYCDGSERRADTTEVGIVYVHGAAVQ